MVNYLGTLGMKARVQAMERAAFFRPWHDKTLKGIIIGGLLALEAAVGITPLALHPVPDEDMRLKG